MEGRDMERLTTREAALLMGCREADALQLLKAAGITRSGGGRAFLWDAAGVKKLLALLRVPHSLAKNKACQEGRR